MRNHVASSLALDSGSRCSSKPKTELSSARSPNDLLDIQNRYLQENLKELLTFSERLSRLSADKAREASEKLDQKR